MICITGSERTSAELRQRLATYPDALHEVRLDLLEQIDERAMAACASQQRIITCRPKREGGGYRADEQQRIDVLLQACERAPGYIDVELSAPVPLRQKLRAALHDKTKLVLSWHDFDGDQPVPWSKLRRADADVLKVAKAIDDATELTELVNAAKVDGRPTVVIGMGRLASFRACSTDAAARLGPMLFQRARPRSPQGSSPSSSRESSAYSRARSSPLSG
jgi:3-dehydroquinate dehydratase type I